MIKEILGKIKVILGKIPGFRSGHKWKMALAVIGYWMIIIILADAEGVTFRDKLAEILEMLIVIGIPFVLITNLGNVRSKLPLYKKKKLIATALGVFVTFLIIGMGVLMVDAMKSPEQKQLDLMASQEAAAKSELELEAKEIASNLNKKIEGLGDIESLTDDQFDEVISIRKDYDALTSQQKGFVTKLDLLVSAEKKKKDILAEIAMTLDDRITALGDVESFDIDKENDIILIRKDYEAFTSEQKGLVTKLALLETAEKKIKDIKKEMVLTLDDEITALGDADSLTYDKADIVISIRKEYDAFTSEQKGLVTNLVLLESAEKKMADLKIIADKEAAEEKAEADQKAAEEKAEADQKAAEEKAEADQIVAEAKEAEDYQNWINSQFSAWDGSNTYLVKLIKENLNDPKSFEHVETVYSDEGTYILVKMTYRANNAFGGLVLQNVTAKVDYETQYISVVSQND